MARKRQIYNWPIDWADRKFLRALIYKTLDEYLAEIGDGHIRLDDVLANCLDNGNFRLRLDPSVPMYRVDVDEKTLRSWIAELLRKTLERNGASIFDQDATIRRQAYVWVPDHPEQQLSGGFYRLLGALADEELERFYKRNQKLRVAFQVRELAAEVEREQRVPAETKVKVKVRA